MELPMKSVTSELRGQSLRKLLSKKKGIRVIEAHSPLSAMLVEKASYTNGNVTVEFDAFWSSSLTDSTVRGKPDTELLDLKSRLNGVSDIFEVTTKPLILDGDTGGKAEHLPYHIATAERMGVSAVIIEDKTGLKKNSLFGNDVKQTQADPIEFAEKIRLGKNAQLSSDFMLIARIESLILDAGLDDALKRALLYVESGADGVMIHSRKKDPSEIIEFAKRFRTHYPSVPLVCVPTSFNDIKFDTLVDNGFNVVIYANHMLRAAYPAMLSVANQILKYGRTLEVEDRCLDIQEILSLIPGTR
ncbi:phosphoenolpyruvate mutase [Pseudomonas fluorescens]|uniref:phosphoenolpyruvate mutase n=1 Tax=Pseudomonas fluorescens TaxID=294 RepID=UPI0009D70A02|nr:phosphoenolpyruvate mutase [Pseudomonas fluorescens]